MHSGQRPDVLPDEDEVCAAERTGFVMALPSSPKDELS